MRSIQSRLIVAITATCVAFLSVTGLLLYRAIRADLVRDFDRALSAEAQAVASLVSLEPSGKLDFEYNPAAMPQYQRDRQPHYFIIHFDDGRVFAASKSLQGVAPPQIEPGTNSQDVQLPSGAKGRALRLKFVAQRDPDAPPPAGGVRPVTPPQAMNVTVARDRATLTKAIERILRMFIIAASALALAVAATVVAIVRASTRPLRAVSDRAAEIGPTRLDLRLPEAGLPAELAPICRCLNELLARLDAAFARERRFTADVAHELRTPIAELRSVIDVALRWPDDPGATEHALREAQQIAVQMQTLVQTLLDLVRAAGRTSPVALEPIRLADAVERATRATESAHGVQRRVDTDVPDDAAVMAEATLLSSVLGNVLSNALEYADGSGPVICRAQEREGRWVLSVENRARDLTADDLRHIRDPFWRKDSARSRSDSTHAGLGLSLVDAFCGLMGVGLHVELREPEVFSVQLSFGAAPSSRFMSSSQSGLKELTQGAGR